ncbi:MAG: efflux RND transporter periplasmic adaptor subunit [Desulfobacteraceae bacterium]|nr:MAG: efflux RND transporter periplasmic adaptor subunit [Desulfobacteraceae bacterium]
MAGDDERGRGRSYLMIVALTSAVTLLVAGGAAYFLGYLGGPRSAPMEMAEKGKGGQDQKAGGVKEKKILYWRSSMNPNEVYDAPGKDSMGMDLVPVYEGEEAGPPGTVKIDPTTTQNIGVKTAEIRRRRLVREIRTVGRVAYNEKRVRRITSKIGGWVEQQHVNFEGQEVEKGEPVLEIYSPDLVSAQEEYLIALKNLQGLRSGFRKEGDGGSEALLRAAETRLRYWDITEEQIEALRERGEITRTMVLHSPFKGVVTQKKVLEGGYVTPGQDLYSIADLSVVWVYADIYEYEVPWIKVGQEAVMTLAYHPGMRYVGKVSYIYPYLKNMTRTLQVRMEFSNTEDLSLKPDMWANVSLQSAFDRETLAIPIQAVIRTGTRDIALIALPDGRFEPRELRLGPQAGEEFVVLEGLKEGERVVTSAQFLINSESNLQAALSKMRKPQAPAAHEGHPPETPPRPSEKMQGMEMEESAPTTPVPPNHEHPAMAPPTSMPPTHEHPGKE